MKALDSTRRVGGLAPIILILAIAVIIGGGTFAVVKRDVLKSFFQTGEKPTQNQLTNPINPSPNLPNDRTGAGGNQTGGAQIQPAPTPTPISVSKTFTGVVYTGASQGTVKSFCKEGLYLALDPGLKMNAQQSLLLLRDRNKQMFADSTYVNKRVVITGTYPEENAIRCEALICGCEEYLIVETISVVSS